MQKRKLTLDECWSKVLNEYYSKGLIEEGLSDTLKGWSSGLSKMVTGDKNADDYDTSRSTYRQNVDYAAKEKEQGTGHGDKGSLAKSWGRTALNVVGHAMAGLSGTKNYKALSGGVFDKDTRNHAEDVKTMQNTVKEIVADIMNHAALMRMLYTECKPTHFVLVQVNNGQYLQMRDSSTTQVAQLNNMTSYQTSQGAEGFTNPNSDPTAGNAQSIEVKKWLMSNNQNDSSVFLSNPPQGKEFANLKNYEWIRKEIRNLLATNVINFQQVTAQIAKIRYQLNAIDRKIDKYCIERGYSTMAQVRKSKAITYLLQEKVQIMEEMTNNFLRSLEGESARWQLIITTSNGTKQNILPYFINLQNLQKKIVRLGTWTVKCFREGRHP